MVSKSMNAKIIAAVAVFAMMFAGFGVIIGAQADDAVTTEYAGDSIVIKDSMAIEYENVDGDLYMAITADLDLGKAGLSPGDASTGKFTKHLKNFVTAIDTYYDDAVVTFEIPFEVPKGKTVEDFVPASFLVYFTDDAFIVTVEKESDFAILNTVELNYCGADKITLGTDVDMAAVALVAEDIAVITAAEAEEIAETIAELTAQVLDDQLAIAALEAYIEELEDDTEGVIAALKAVIEELEAEIDADEKTIAEQAEAIAIKDAKIADLEKQLAEKKGGDATIAWCVAAIGLIAAVVLAGFLVFVAMKAKKAGRRLLN